MRVLVTGGTGFIGAHTVKALLDAGHEVRLLVRNPERINRNVEPLGAMVDDYALGDMTDEDALRKALEGCDAAVHCAALVALDRRHAKEVLETNLRGAEVVLGSAVERGLDPIVHVSSTAALFAPGLSVLHSDLPPADVRDAYGRSKAAAESYARGLQEKGAPITITYPGSVIGPPAGDAFGEVAGGLVQQFKMGVFAVRDAAWSIIDVRDVAKIHATLVEPGLGPRRFMCGGHFLNMDGTAEIYREITGRRFPVFSAPSATLRGLGRLMDAVARVAPIDTVFTAEGMTIYTKWFPTDDARIRDELGIELRDPRESFADALIGLYEAGRLSARQVGRLAQT